MGNLEISSWKIKSARLGPNNPLPPLYPERVRPQIEISDDLPQEINKQMKYGHVPTVLPYAIQNEYQREQQTTETTVAVLENEILRATFLLELGGRLWSLYHKPSQRELLEVNPTVQAANLAIRNAWFSGGVEWNIGTIGHSPFSFDPLFAARILRDDGTEMLRLYEWERFRQTPFQIDAWLPPDSPVLFLYIRICNPHDFDLPIYWWTNIAIPETPETRVICPTDTAYCLGFEPDRLKKTALPISQGNDLSYPKNYSHAADIFFEVRKKNHPWITALDGDGNGLFQISTANLHGRKMWVWGSGTGGQNWQKFLSPQGKGYLEIQAGLTRTQLEHRILSGGSELAWVESYGLISIKPQLVHSLNWNNVCKSVKVEMDQLIPPKTLERERIRADRYKDRKPDDIIQRGSGWGSLENLRRELNHHPPCCPPGLEFDEVAFTDEQLPWVQLLRTGDLPTLPADKLPPGFLVHEPWIQKLQQAVSSTATENWFAWYHLGLMYYFKGDYQDARSVWQHSFDLTPNPWALRNIALIYWKDGHIEQAAKLLAEAHNLVPSLLQLTIELGKCLIEAGKSDFWLDMVQKLPPAQQAHGRIRLLEAQAAVAEKNIQIVKLFFDDQIIPSDLREGETSLAELWFAYQLLRISEEQPPGINRVSLEQIKLKFPVPDFADFNLGV
jgi:tetratricopeptide (TPR) repeat protein